MAFPVVQQAIESATSTASTSHVVTLPTATAGQLLLIILDKGSTSATIDAHASLTELLDEASANGLYIAYRWMDGTEPASYTLTSSASTRSAQIAYRISGAENPATTAPQIGTTGTGTSATPDPPASASPGSAKDYLFIAFAGMAGEEADDDTWGNTPPTNYTPSPPRQISCGVAGTDLGGLILSAERQLNTGSAENPGTFGVDVSAAWRSQTIMIHPVAPVTHATTGALTGPGATVVGSASSKTTRPSSGVLTGPGSVVAGSATRFRAHANTGVLSGAGAVVVGSAARMRAHAATGDLAGPAAVVDGAAARVGVAVAHDASGDLVGAGAVVEGAVSGSSVAVSHRRSLPRRKFLVTIEGNRYIVPEEELHNWLSEKEDELVEKVAEAPKPRIKRRKGKSLPVVDIPVIRASDAPEWLSQIVAATNQRVRERVDESRVQIALNQLEDDEEDAMIALLML